MKNLLILITLITLFSSCSQKTENTEYLKGEPIILKKEVSIIPGYCIFHYEGWGRREYFEDKCDKYSIGDKITTQE